MYSRVTLKDNRAADPADLPEELRGLEDDSLRDLSAALDPVPKSYVGVGFWPATVTVPDHDEREQTTDGYEDVIADPRTRTVGARARLRPLTSEELDALPPIELGSISDRQFFQALAMEPYSIITSEEALAAVKTGEIPAIMAAVVDQLPPDAQFDATMKIAGGTIFNHDDPLVAVFGASQGMNASAIRQFWIFAGAL